MSFSDFQKLFPNVKNIQDHPNDQDVVMHNMREVLATFGAEKIRFSYYSDSFTRKDDFYALTLQFMSLDESLINHIKEVGQYFCQKHTDSVVFNGQSYSVEDFHQYLGSVPNIKIKNREPRASERAAMVKKELQEHVSEHMSETTSKKKM